MRNITFVHVLILLVGSLATNFYLNYQTRQEISDLKQTIGNQNFFNSVLLEEIRDLKSDALKTKTDVLIGQLINTVEDSFTNTKIDDLAKDCQGFVDYINELIVNQNSQLPEASLLTYSAPIPKQQGIDLPCVLPDATALAGNVGLEMMNALAGLNSGLSIPEYYSERNRYARHNIFWPTN